VGVGLVLALLGCGCAIFASKAELRLVERMQRETDPVARADALQDYDSRFAGGGRLLPRVTGLRDQIDDGYWDYVSGQGLEQVHVDGYLARFPEGNHAGEARRRVDQLRYFAEAAAARAEAQRQAEEAERQRVEEENERQRARVRTGLERWLRTALALPRWGTTIDALAALDEAFREQWAGEPAPVCVADTCRKTIDAFYFFSQTGGTRLDRRLSLVLEVDMREGRVYQLTGYYTGRGFVDWLEMGSAQPVLEEDGESREMARDAMVAMVQGATDAVIPGTSVEETTEEGVLLRFRRPPLVVSVREFPQSFTAGRVDGFEVSYEGEIGSDPAPAP
jgi:hypothetical protein